MSFETTALLIAWVAIVLLALVVAGLVRQVHALNHGAPRSPEIGLQPGSTAPNASRLEHVPGEPLLVLFLSTECGTCSDIFEVVRKMPVAASIRAVYEAGGPAEDPGELRIIDNAKGLFTSFRVPVTPYAVLIDSNARVSKAEPVGSTRALMPLVNDLPVPAQKITEDAQ
jgi:hypothetical protein